MAMGLKTFDRSGTLNLDTTSATWVQVALLEIPSGDTATTVTFSGASLPPGMELRCALLIINDIPIAQKQLTPGVTVTNGSDSTRSVTVISQVGTSTNSENETVEAFSAACKIIILGR